MAAPLTVPAPVAPSRVGGRRRNVERLRSWLALGYLIVFGSCLGFTAYIYLLKHSAPARVGTYAFVNPVVALFLGWALAGEPLTLRTGLAAAIILTAVCLVITAPHRTPAESEAAIPVPEEA